MSKSTVVDIFKRFNALNVVIIGDVMIDRYLEGKVERISPEAPVPVIQLQREENRLGGAGNVALNIQALGATPYLFSVVGQDANGEVLSNLLPASKISSKYLLHSPDRQTTVKTRVIAQHQHLLRVDREDTHDISESEAEQLLQSLRELLDSKPVHVILFQDYNKGVLSSQLIREVILEALRRDIPTVVDPKYNNFWNYKRVTLFKPNLREMQQQLSQPLAPVLDQLQQAAKTVQTKLGNRYTFITLSDKGLFYHSKKESAIVPTQVRNIADVCGAGDTVISITALGLALGLDLATIAMLANIGGGQVCERVGVVPVDKKMLEKEYLAEQNLHISK